MKPDEIRGLFQKPPEDLVLESISVQLLEPEPSSHDPAVWEFLQNADLDQHLLGLRPAHAFGPEDGPGPLLQKPAIDLVPPGSVHILLLTATGIDCRPPDPNMFIAVVHADRPWSGHGHSCAMSNASTGTRPAFVPESAWGPARFQASCSCSVPWAVACGRPDSGSQRYFSKNYEPLKLDF